jgi:polyhydroxyalkanoate synthesis regulator phasin
MATIIEQGFLLSLGAAALAKERLQGLVDDSVKRGQISRQVGEQLVEDYTRKAMAEGGELRSRVGSGLQDIARELGLVTRGEWHDMELKVAQLEHRLALLEQEGEQAATPEA